MDSEKIIFCERLLINNPRQRTEKNGHQVQLTVTELDCRYNRDQADEIKSYRMVFIKNGKREEKTFHTSYIDGMIEHFLIKLAKVVDNLDYRVDKQGTPHHQIVPHRANRWFRQKKGACHYCGRTMIYFYGICHGIVKKCRRCGRLSTLKIRGD